MQASFSNRIRSSLCQPPTHRERKRLNRKKTKRKLLMRNGATKGDVVLDERYRLTLTDWSCIALTHWLDSIVHGRTVSVRPSRNKRVILASYVKLNLPASFKNWTRHKSNYNIVTKSPKMLSVSYPIVGQLEGHLDESVGTDATFLHQTFAESRVGQQTQVDVVDQRQCHLECMSIS